MAADNTEADSAGARQRTVLTASANSDGRQRGLRSRLRRFVERTAGLFVVLGVLLRTTVRDEIPVFSAIFYGLPLGMLMFLASLVALHAYRRRQKRYACAWIATAGALAVWWYTANWSCHDKPETEGEIRIAVWNVCRGVAGWERIAREVAALDADVVALIEAGEATEPMRALWRRHCPGYDVSLLGGGMVCLTRGTAGDAKVIPVDNETQIRQIDATVRGRTVTCILVDVHSDPLYSRRMPLEALARVSASHNERPTVILGDFNTPVDSVHFAPLRRNHVNAFEAAGDGYAASWPGFAPLLTLDQIWVSLPARVRHCELGWSPLSDHRPVFAEIAILPDASAAQTE